MPDELFEESFARTALKDHGPERTDYYRAVLQNLFFATLNTEINKRAFSKKTPDAHRDFNKYRYHSLLVNSDDFIGIVDVCPLREWRPVRLPGQFRGCQGWRPEHGRLHRQYFDSGS